MKLLAIYFLLSVNAVLSANILYLHGVISVSHHIWNRRLAMELALRGHNVTFVSVDEEVGENKTNLHYIVLENTYENLYGKIEFNILEMAKYNKENKLKGASAATDYGTLCCKAIHLSIKGLETILSYPNNFKFDLIVNDFSLGSCLLPLAHKFKYPPTVGVSPFLNPPTTTFVIGGHKYPGYVPHFIIDFPQLMSFYQRICNHIFYWMEKM